jgi:hypothetical protein
MHPSVRVLAAAIFFLLPDQRSPWGDGSSPLAKLRRSKFGARSERIERVLERLELALEEAETAKAEAIAAQRSSPSRKWRTPRHNRPRTRSPRRRSAVSYRPSFHAATSCMRRPACAKPAAVPSCAR